MLMTFEIRYSPCSLGCLLQKLVVKKKHNFISAFIHKSVDQIFSILTWVIRFKRKAKKKPLEHFKHVIKVCPNRGYIF